MPQDAFHIRRLVAELNFLLKSGKINRISQVDKDELTFIIYTGKSTVKLILSANASNARVCLSETEKEPAPQAPNFCMLLRKHLQGAEILEIRQHNFERIVEIDLFCRTDFSESTRTLRCELMGKYSNILLCEKEVLLGALKTTALEDSSRRVLFPGAKYQYPVPQDKLSPFDRAGMRSTLKNFVQMHADGWDKESLSLFLFERVAGLALPTAREIVKRAILQNGENGVLSDDGKNPLWNFVGDFCENEPCAPCLVKKADGYADFFAFPVENGISQPSLCKAEDLFFTSKEQAKSFEGKRRKLESAVKTLRKKLTKKLQDVAEKLKEAENAEENRVKGELLTANLYRFEKGATHIVVENWYDPDGGSLKIALDSTLSPAKNAQRYFKLYNKQKRAKEILTPMLEDTQKELSYAEGILSCIALAEETDDFKEIESELIENGLLRAPKERAGGKKKETAVPFREYLCGGFKIFVGRNNLQNDRLLKFAAPDDIWLHAQKYHSSHVIISVGGRQVRDEVLLFAAELCAYYSDGRGADKLPVDYCKRKFVKKPSKSKAGFVVYTDYKTLLVKPNAHK